MSQNDALGSSGLTPGGMRSMHKTALQMESERGGDPTSGTPKGGKKKKKKLDSRADEQFAAAQEDEIKAQMEREYQLIRKETFRILISNSLFYNKIGKYPQIMDLFKLIGFRRVSNQFTSAFCFLKDPTPDAELNEMWEETLGTKNEADKTAEQLSRTTVLAKRFNTNRKGFVEHSTQFINFRAHQEEGVQVPAAIHYLEISKIDVEIIYQVKETYMQLKYIISCCGFDSAGNKA